MFLDIFLNKILFKVVIGQFILQLHCS